MGKPSREKSALALCAAWSVMLVGCGGTGGDADVATATTGGLGSSNGVGQSTVTGTTGAPAGCLSG